MPETEFIDKFVSQLTKEIGAKSEYLLSENDNVTKLVTDFKKNIQNQYIKRALLEKQINKANEVLLSYAMHKYGSVVDLVDEDDLFSSLATSVNLLGEELNHSTVTKNYLEDIFNSITDMLIVVDEFGYIDSINNSTACKLKYQRKNILRRNILEILEDEKSFNTLIEEAQEKGTSIFVNRKGEELSVAVNISPFVRGDNKKIGSVIIARDISELLKHQQEIEERNVIITQANEELKMAIHKIEETDKLKTAFLQNVSHEIRTPLNSIIGLTYILNNEPVTDEEKEEFSSVIEKSGNRLIEIVNNILEISKIETGQYEVSSEFFSINELMKEVYNVFFQETLRKDIRLTYKCEFEHEDATIFSDEYVVNQVMTNLIKNAIKFTQKGEISFGYTRKGKSLEFYVRDTGIGISAENKFKIFDRFTQADTSLSRSHEGAGLGLSISKGIIELLGGKIWVKSRLGHGSTFYFSIPYHPQTKEEVVKEAAVNIGEINKELGKLNMLVVEDDDLNYLYFFRSLKPSGHELTRAVNGLEAVDFCKENDYDIVLMDIKMPIMDGIEATKQIKQLKPQLPVIALTAFAFNEEKINLKKIGFNDYLTKPLKVEQIYLAIQKCLRTQRS